MANNKCESCTKGYNGQNGSGYMPCGCNKQKNKVKPPKKPKFKGWDL
nr:MAG TPA: hypothetical protein [Caudoviricetes sp.]